MKTFDDWKTEIAEYLTTHKSFAQFNQKISTSDVMRLKRHFSEEGYSVEVRKCSQCGGWDVIITK